MAEPLRIPKVDDPLAALRRSVEAHRAVTQASVDAGAQLRAEREQPPVEPGATA